ncbi:DNA translocase FtsK 4TM domain-containing protein, partial [bacterium]|nr:DNA translocase FtsK 4TM domain-containing protein [bacterium]
MAIAKLTIKRQEWKAEMAGILFLGFAIFLLMALLSYSPRDPSLNHTISGSVDIANLGGRIGALTADLLLQGVGFGSLILPLYLLGVFVGLLNSKKYPPLTSLGGMLLLIVCTAIWSALIIPVWQVQGTEVLTGGALGRVAGETLLTLFNPIGTYLLMSVFLALSLIVTTHISPLRIAGLLIFSLVASGHLLMQSFKRVFWLVAGLFKRSSKSSVDEVSDSPQKAKKRLKKVKIGRTHAEKPKPAPMNQGALPFLRGSGRITLPSLNLLDDPPPKRKKSSDDESLRLKSQQLENKLRDYGVQGQVVAVHPGPVVTMYEFQPAAGVKLSKISSLADDLALAMSAMSVRIVAPIPGKAVVGIEIPNIEREGVNFKELLLSAAFQKTKSALPMALGKEIDGVPMVADLAKMPHLLIAGSTGSGKSVGINCLICSILFKAMPDQVKFIMVDPKRLELSVYDHIPHLLLPVVTNPKRAAAALAWAVEEMERRYALMSKTGTGNVASYNRFIEKELAKQNQISKPEPEPDDLDVGFENGAGAGGEAGDESEESLPLEKFPYIVIIIDELADLMMVASKDVESSIARLAQMARAAGMHLILATQRPSVDVLTGLIKANFPTRISFKVSSKIDSRTIL